MAEKDCNPDVPVLSGVEGLPEWAQGIATKESNWLEWMSDEPLTEDDILDSASDCREVLHLCRELAKEIGRRKEAEAAVTEWLCPRCNTIYPPNSFKTLIPFCPSCGTSCGPKNAVELRRTEAKLQQAVEALETIAYDRRKPMNDWMKVFVWAQKVAQEALNAINPPDPGPPA